MLLILSKIIYWINQCDIKIFVLVIDKSLNVRQNYYSVVQGI